MDIKKKNTILIGVVSASLIALVIILAGVSRFRAYDSYEIEDSFRIEGTSGLNFLPFADGILAYSRDGAVHYEKTGATVWNEAYNMLSPVAVTNGSRLIVYDRQGSTLVAMSEEKELWNVSTNHTIVDAAVSADGTVAVLSQDGETGYISLYNDQGKQAGSGQVHLDQTGYPMSLAISDDGKRLIVSFEYPADGRLATRVNIYDFSEDGDRQKDNIMASFRYKDTVCPEVAYFSDGRACAFTGSGVRIYSAGRQIKEAAYVKAGYNIAAVAAGKTGFALIRRDKSDKGVITVYSDNGKEKFRRNLLSSYERVFFLDDGRVMIKSGRQVDIFTRTGRKWFTYRFPDQVEAFIPGETLREFFLVQRDSTQIIKLS